MEKFCTCVVKSHRTLASVVLIICVKESNQKMFTFAPRQSLNYKGL